MKDFMEIRVAVVGNVDAGKSTLLGVLTHGELDNGRDAAFEVGKRGAKLLVRAEMPRAPPLEPGSLRRGL